jgi:serine protease DegQ
MAAAPSTAEAASGAGKDGGDAGTGSAVVIDPAKGIILTNAHVIDGADEITVVFADGRELQARRVGSDAGTDVAVI